MKVTSIKQAKAGIFTGVLSGITWGLDTVLVGIVLAMSPFIENDGVIFLAPFVSAFLHDTFSTMWMFIYMGFKGEIGKVFKALNTKDGRVVMLAALMGGPVGMTGYLLAVKYIGPAYTASISSIYPAVGALFAFFFLKERLNVRAWLGLALSIIGIIGLGYIPADGSVSNFVLGFIFAIVCVLGWALESVICAWGMKNEEVTPEQALHIRQLISAVFYGVVIIPILGGHFLSAQALLTKASALLAITALSGTISYVVWYMSIHWIGATRGMALNITYAAWAMFFQVIILHVPITTKFVVCSLAIMFGSVLVAGNPKDMIDLTKDLEEAPQVEEVIIG